MDGADGVGSGTLLFRRLDTAVTGIAAVRRLASGPSYEPGLAEGPVLQKAQLGPQSQAWRVQAAMSIT